MSKRKPKKGTVCQARLEYIWKDAFEKGIVRSGVVYHTHVFHDPDCRLLAGHGDCNCQPDIHIDWGNVPSAIDHDHP